MYAIYIYIAKYIVCDPDIANTWTITLIILIRLYPEDRGYKNREYAYSGV